MISVSGFNVHPNEITGELSKQGKVAEANVNGLLDAKTGETVHAYVVNRDDALSEPELAANCKGLRTAFKCPEKVHFRDELPKRQLEKSCARTCACKRKPSWLKSTDRRTTK
jgi:long-chain acyl-CoA synthetase